MSELDNEVYSYRDCPEDEDEDFLDPDMEIEES